MKTQVLIIAFTAIAVCSVITGCSSSKKVSAQNKSAMQKNGGQSFSELIDLPCQVMDSGKDYIVTSGEGKSKDRPMAKDKAYLNALGNLSSKLSAVAAREVKRVGVSTQVNTEEDMHDKVVAVAEEISKANVAGYRVSCEKFVIYNDGSFGCFVSIEFGKDKFVKEMYDGLSKKQLLRADYDFDKYNKMFEEDLREYERGNR